MECATVFGRQRGEECATVCVGERGGCVSYLRASTLASESASPSPFLILSTRTAVCLDGTKNKKETYMSNFNIKIPRNQLQLSNGNTAQKGR